MEKPIVAQFADRKAVLVSAHEKVKHGDIIVKENGNYRPVKPREVGERSDSFDTPVYRYVSK